MSQLDWIAAKALFEKALEKPEAEREQFVLNACENQRDLCRTVLGMLEVDTDSGGLDLSRVVTDAAGELMSSAYELEAGSVVGQYRIIEKIAEGGMGSVYLGERADGSYQQQVGIKLLHATLFSEEALRRFQRERQILADLDHQYIARLLDGGTTEQGIPFLVMEYVEGLPLMAYIEKHQLRLEARLGVFLQICDAVAYAHQHLVIHQDIKPANVMVTEQREVKLLDFGIAKIQASEQQSADNQKKEDSSAMTPESASPEQILSQTVSTGSDVYSLGVLLFRIITGQSPYLLKQDNLAQLKHAICHQKTPLPSVVLNDKKWQKRVRGDLDTIVTKATEKVPSNRYSSAAAIADDIRFHLRRQPIKARSDNVLYQISKLIWRFPKTFFAACGAITLFVGTISFYTIQVAEQRNLAQQQLAVSQQVTGFLTDIFTVSDPTESLGNSITAREILDQGASRIESTLMDQPDIQFQLRHTIGSVYLSLGITSVAEQLLQKERLYREQYSSADPQALVANYLQLAKLREMQGNLDQAEALYKSALNIQSGIKGDQTLEMASIELSLSGVLQVKGQFDQAIDLQAKVLDAQRQSLPDDSKAVIATLRAQSLMLFEVGSYTDAVKLAEEVHQLVLKQYGEMHPETAHSYSDWGYFVDQLGNFEQAKALLLKALVIDQKIYGDLHPVIAGDLVDLGSTVSYIDEREAIGYLQRAIAMGGNVINENHPILGVAHNDLAGIYKDLKNLEKAEYHYLKALDINQFLFGEQHPEVATNHSNIGLMYARNEQSEKAKFHLFKAMELRLNIFGKSHPHIAASLSVIGSYFYALRDYLQAADFFDRSLRMKQRYYPEESAMVNAARVRVARAYMRLNRFMEAGEILEKANQLMDRSVATASQIAFLTRTLLEYLGDNSDCDQVLRYTAQWNPVINDQQISESLQVRIQRSKRRQTECLNQQNDIAKLNL